MDEQHHMGQFLPASSLLFAGAVGNLGESAQSVVVGHVGSTREAPTYGSSFFVRT